MKKSTFLLAIALCSIHLGASAQDGYQWLDMTHLINNPRFENNTNDGWDCWGNASSQNLSYGCQEFWNGTFDIWQTLWDIPNGKYRLSVNGYYRIGDNSWSLNQHNNGTEEITAFLYANLDSIPLKSTYSEQLPYNYNGGCWSPNGGGWGWWGDDNTEYYPNNMEAASYCFSQGMYLNELEFEVTGNGVTLGILNDNYNSSNWAIFTNFKLEYFGVLTPVESISFEFTELNMLLGEILYLEPTILPSDATYKMVEWSSSDPSVVSVYEDGRIQALSNGTAIITATSTDNPSISASCTITVNQNDATPESLIINEIMAANVDMFIDPSWNYGGFVELYNPTDVAVSIGGFYVSDDAENLQKCHLPITMGIIPAHGYKTLWFDNSDRHAPTQVDMKLDNDGGTIYISNQDGKLIARQQYPESMARISYARTTDGGSEWGTTAFPTPSYSNNESQFANIRLDAPTVDKDGQLFSGTLNISVYIPEGATLRYTTDGMTPTLDYGEISETGLFSISETTVFRFRLFQDGKLPSPVVSRSYIYQDRDYQLPIISVITDLYGIYGDEYGIFVQGSGNGLVGNGQSAKCNWNTDWERPVHFEYITTDNQCILSQEADMSSCGGWSRAWNPHSFKLKAGKKFDEHLNYFLFQPFQEKQYLRHKVLQIRNGGNDTQARFIDPSIQEIIQRSGIDIDGQAYQPTIHFINGYYMGVINMREPNNKHFALANRGIDTDEMDQFEMSPDSGYVQKEGDKTYFKEWYDLSFDAADDAVYEKICNSYVDIDEFTNYIASQLYIGGTDFPQNNVKAYRPRIENGKFRFVSFDLDFAFNASDPFSNMFGKQYYTFDTLYDLTDAIASGRTLIGNRIYDEIEVVTIFINMLQNDTFRKKFIDTFCLIAGSVFEPTRCQAIVDELKARVYDSMENYERSALNSSANKVRNGFSKSLQNSRTNLMKNNYDEYFHLRNVERQQLSFSANIPDAHIFYNDMPVPTNKFSGYAFAPVTLRASAPAGYRFVGWQTGKGSTTTTDQIILLKGSSWSYFTSGSLDGTNWKSEFDGRWATGNAPLGYYTSDSNNGRGYQTFLDYGNDADNKRPTYYFQHQLPLSNEPTDNDEFILNFVADDGFIIYVNGMEAGRYLMRDGEATYSSYASSYAPGNPDEGSLTLPANLFHRGINLIAVELHNNANNSTDVYWDAEIVKQTSITTGIETLSTDEAFTLPSKGNLNITACYEPLSPAELAETDARPVKINEVSASNSVYVNEYFKKNDWIELHNTTGDSIDVAGMYLSDNLKNPTKYQIPAASLVENNYSTVIPPYGFLVLWCDKLDNLTQLHTNFKLSAEPAEVLLTAADQTWCDTLSYVTHNGDESAGIYPDGGTLCYVMTTPTPGQANRLNSYAILYEENHTYVDAIPSLQLTANGTLRLSRQTDQLVIRTEEPTHATISIYTLSGQLLETQTVRLSSIYRHSTAQFPAGIYVARVRNAEGEECTIKFKQ
ncbi:MAG: lamin tail domain-containing protein [Bacteroidaceae bacterium]|nr:lamin tail domain-containing protein [Bacteroidaceae bacterium]